MEDYKLHNKCVAEIAPYQKLALEYCSMYRASSVKGATWRSPCVGNIFPATTTIRTYIQTCTHTYIQREGGGVWEGGWAGRGGGVLVNKCSVSIIYQKSALENCSIYKASSVKGAICKSPCVGNSFPIHHKNTHAGHNITHQCLFNFPNFQQELLLGNKE